MVREMKRNLVLEHFRIRESSTGTTIRMTSPGNRDFIAFDGLRVTNVRHHQFEERATGPFSPFIGFRRIKVSLLTTAVKRASDRAVNRSNASREALGPAVSAEVRK